jgi:hypothetical protein
MPESARITGMPLFTPNIVTKDITFVLSVEGSEPIDCVANFGAAAQIASSFGTALRVLRMALEEQSAWVTVATELLRAVDVQKSPLSGDIIMQATTTQGVPYIFRIPPQMAIALADRLRTEALKDISMGSA